MLLAHLGAAVLVQALGWVCIWCAWQAYYQGKGDALRRTWKLLKLGAVPFYVLNFLWSGFCWLMLVGASRGLMIFFVPIPIIFTCLLVLQSGCVAHRYLRWLIERPGGQQGITSFLTFLQFVPVLDILSTVLLLKLTAAEEQERERTG